jgi:cell division protein FtsW (lipid II flippase)
LRLLETLAEAFRIGRNRISQAGFLAALLLIPPFLLMLLPADFADAVVIGLSVIGELLAWVAFAYCAEYLQSVGAPTPVAQD